MVDLVGLWNELYPVGTAVIVRKDFGGTVRTTTRSEAKYLPSGAAVIWLEGITGCYLLDRVEAIEQKSVQPPDRWMCPNCHGIIEEITYATLPRAAFQGAYGVYTTILCPLCKQQTIGMAWKVVEVTGTEGIA